MTLLETSGSHILNCQGLGGLEELKNTCPDWAREGACEMQGLAPDP